MTDRLPDSTVIDLDPVEPLSATRLDMDIVPADPRLRDTHDLHVVQASSEEEARAIVAARLGLKRLPAGAVVQSRLSDRRKRVSGEWQDSIKSLPDPSKLGG